MIDKYVDDRYNGYDHDAIVARAYATDDEDIVTVEMLRRVPAYMQPLKSNYTLNVCSVTMDQHISYDLIHEGVAKAADWSINILGDYYGIPNVVSDLFGMHVEMMFDSMKKSEYEVVNFAIEKSIKLNEKEYVSMLNDAKNR